MKASRELDALIAEKVMGWIPWLENRGEYYHVVWQKDDREPYRRSRDWEAQMSRYKRITHNEIIYGKHIEHMDFKPSTQIAAAKLTTTKILEMPNVSEVIIVGRTESGWNVGFLDSDGVSFAGDWGETEELARCLAALRAKGREEEYDAMLEKQGDVCIICAGTSDLLDRRLDIDHDHDTGEIRGLLCSRCNRGLTLFRESPLLLRTAALYLE